MKNLLFILFLLPATLYAQLNVDKLSPSNGYGEKKHRLMVTDVQLIPNSQSFSNPGSLPGQIKVMGNKLWFTDANGTLRSSNEISAEDGTLFTEGPGIKLTGDPSEIIIRSITEGTPSSTTDPQGNVADQMYDNNYRYIKTATGWKRTPLSSF